MRLNSALLAGLFAIVTGNDMPGAKLRGLAGKRVSLGLPRSGSRSSVGTIVKTNGDGTIPFAAATERTLDSLRQIPRLRLRSTKLLNRCLNASTSSKP